MKLFAFRDRIRLNALAVLGRSLFALTCLLASSLRSAEDEDIVIDAFDGASFEGWHVTGKAFGNGPVRGTLPNQMNVDGYLGMGYVNSYHDGDGSIGTMQSKEFLIERPYINFLIGGGAFPGQTCIRLRVDGQVVAESVGPNRNSGGSERLQWNGWDVRQWQGQKGSIEIIDDHVGGWGHISIDQLVQSDTSRGPKDYSREIQISQDYLLLPVDASAPLVSLQALDGPTLTHRLDVSLGSSKADFRFLRVLFQGICHFPVRA
jgi:fructan beta-fructosidase